MRIALGCDHRGRGVMQRMRASLEGQGHTVVVFGPEKDGEPYDYPDAGYPASTCVSQGKTDRAILFCGSGIGMSIVANKVRGVRAALCHDELTAEMSRRHNDANVLCIPADLLGDALIDRIIQAWLTTPFEAGRHERRVKKITGYESREESNRCE